MVKLSRTVEYAVQAVLMLAKADRSHPIPCSQLASEGGMPQRFLLQVLRNLVLHEVVNSTRGVEGGYSLARPAEQITVLDVFEAIEGPVVSSPRPGILMAGGVQTRLHETFHTAASAMRAELAAVSMLDLLKSATNSDRAPASDKISPGLPVYGPPASTYWSSEPRT
jgi:Rrf2 family protein